MVSGHNFVATKLNIENNASHYYNLCIYEASPHAATFDYLITANTVVTTLDRNGIKTIGGTIGGMTLDSTGIGAVASDLNATRIDSGGTFSFCHRVGSSWTQFFYSSGNNVVGFWTAGSTSGQGNDAGIHISGDAPSGFGSSWIRYGWSDVVRSDGYAVSWYNASDRRLKKDIKAISASKIRAFFEKISPIQFFYNKKSQADTSKRHFGVVAQEIEEVLNEIGLDDTQIVEERGVLRTKFVDDKFVDTRENYKYVHYDELHGLYMGAIKDLYEQIDDLKAQIAELKGKE